VQPQSLQVAHIDHKANRTTLNLPPKFTAGRYRIRQVPAPGANLRDVDFLLGKDLYFSVGERKEP